MRKNSQNQIEFKTSNTQGKEKKREKTNLIKYPKTQKIIYKHITYLGS